MRRAFLFLVLSLPLGAASAAADTITITGGFLYAAGFEVISPPSTVTGTDGFRLVTRVAVGTNSGNLGPLSLCFTGSDCQPGTQVNAGGHLDSFGGALFFNELSFRGSDYDLSSGDASLVLRPSGMFTVPEFGAANAVTITIPFTLTGSFSTFFEDPEFNRILGQGIATVRLVKHENPELLAWRGQSVRFDFEPPAAVPEPASLLLLGSGLVGILYRKRCKKAKAS